MCKLVGRGQLSDNIISNTIEASIRDTDPGDSETLTAGGAIAISAADDSKITADAIASIRTQGFIGDKYIKIIQGADEGMLGEGDLIFDTESSIDFEELVSKYIFKSD